MSGGGGSQPTQTSSTVTQQTLSPEQRALIAPGIPVVQEFVENPPQPFQGQKIVPFNPLEQAGQAGVVNAATGAVQQLADTAARQQQFLAGPVLDPRQNPGLQGAIQAGVRPIFQGLTEQALPNIRLGAALSGQPGSTRQGIAEGLASRGALQAAGDTAANIVNPAYQAGLDASSRALALAPQTAGLQFGPSTALGGVGAQLRGMEQAQLNQTIQDFVNEQMLPFLAAREAILLGTGIPGGTVASESVGPSPFAQPSTFQTGLGGALAGAGLGSAIYPGIGTGVGAGLGALAALLS